MKSIAVATLALFAASPALAQQGVSPTEIVVGTAQDLSGPIVNFSKAAVNGMRMRVDEVNAAGGIHGRKLRLVVEDHGYDPKKAVLAAQKMVQQDKIFAALGSIGTPTAMAAMPIYLDAKVAHLFPLYRRARNVRAARAAEVLVRGALLRSDPRRHQAAGEGEGAEEGLHASIRTTTSGSR